MLEVVEVPADGREAWEAFLEQSSNGTLFHSLRFLSYHERQPAEVHPLVFQDSGRILAVLPGAVEEGEPGRVFRSPWGASFGGWALCGGEGFEELTVLVDGLLGWCAERSVRAVDLTHPPIFYAREPNQLLDFVLLTRGFRRHRHEVTDVIPLTGGWNAVSARWDASARKGVRRAREQGVQVQVSDDLGTFYPMLEESRRQHGTAPTHSRKDLERLFELVPGRLRLLLATSGGSPVGGVFLMQCNPRVVMNFYLCHREDAAGLRPADALMEASLRAAVEWGATYYDLGTSSIGGVPNPGLLRFKGKWGTSPFLRETYRKEIEPS